MKKGKKKLIMDGWQEWGRARFPMDLFLCPVCRLIYFYFRLNKLIHIIYLSMQFYKNLSNSLDDIVWKTEEDMQKVK